METLWFILLSATLATYVVLDGFDLGAGALHLFVAKTEKERNQLLRSIGPVWDGNEVWLLAAGGTMFLAFPKLLATALSGFYLPILMVVWLLLFRALGIELRHQVHDSLWTSLWDALFWLSSTLLVVFLGAALGNVVRGVSFQPEGHFFAPLWTHFGLGEPVGILDWYTVIVALEATAVLLHHGARWLVWRTDGALRARAERLAGLLFVAVLLGVVVVTVVSFQVQPLLTANLANRPLAFLFAAPIGAILATPLLARRGAHGAAFLASGLHIYGLLGAVAVSLYPWLLPGRAPGTGLTAQTASSAESSLQLALYWWIPGMILVLVYHAFVYSHLPKTVSADDDDEH